jgi:hypothetical protein
MTMLVRLQWPSIQHEANGRIPPPIPLPCEPWRKAEGVKANAIDHTHPNAPTKRAFMAMAHVRANILAILPQDRSEMTYPQIKERIAAGGNIVREALRRLVQEGEILMRRGDENGKPAHYRLPRS